MADSKALTIAKYHEIEDCEPLPEWLKDRMRHVICANAEGETLAEQVADADLLMQALGVHPKQADDATYLTSHGTFITAGAIKGMGE
jgi:hypothetical protein